MIKDIIFILLGAVCATLGGFLSMWYQVKKARKIKFEETIGEKMVDVYGEALSLILEVKGRWQQDSEENTLKYVEEKTEWIWKNRAFLPSEFYNRWHSIRRNMRKVIRRREDQSIRMKDSTVRLEELNHLDGQIKTLTEEAEKYMLDELNLEPFQWSEPSKIDT